MKILIACDTYPENPNSRERLPAMREALEGYDHEIIDLFDFTGMAHKIRETKTEKEYFQSVSMHESNRKFFDIVIASGCDTLVLCTLDCVSLFLHPKMLKIIQERVIKVVCFFGDDEFMLHRHAHWVERFDKCVAYVKWCADYYNNIVPGSTYYLPLGSYFPKEPTESIWFGDIIFIGAPFDNPDGERPTCLRHLIEKGFDVTIYGGKGWATMHNGFFEPYYNGYLAPKDVVEMIGHYKISLAFLCDHIDGSPHANANIWTTAPAQTMCLSTYYELLFKDYGFTEGENIVTFKDRGDLVRKTYDYLNGIHDEIGKNLYSFVKENFNLVNLYRDFFKSLENL